MPTQPGDYFRIVSTGRLTFDRYEPAFSFGEQEKRDAIDLAVNKAMNYLSAALANGRWGPGYWMRLRQIISKMIRQTVKIQIKLHPQTNSYKVQLELSIADMSCLLDQIPNTVMVLGQGQMAMEVKNPDRQPYLDALMVVVDSYVMGEENERANRSGR